MPFGWVAGGALLGGVLGGGRPDTPDYTGAALAQGKIDHDTALEMAQLNRLDETTPLGSVKYKRIVDKDAPGGVRYERDTTLSPEQQKLYNLDTGNKTTSLNIADSLGKTLGDSVKDKFTLDKYGKSTKVGKGPKFQTIQGKGPQMKDLGTGPNMKDFQSGPELAMTGQGPNPLDVNGPQAKNLGTAKNYAGGAEAVGQALFKRQMALMQPQMQQDVAAMDTQLRNQGLQPGTEAYNRSMQQLKQNQAQQVNDLAGRSVEMQGGEQSRLAGLDLNLDSQRFGQQNTVTQSQLDKIKQALTQRLSVNQANNQANQQEYQNSTSALEHNNANAQQEFQNRATGLNQNNQNTQQEFMNYKDLLGFNNSTAQQGYTNETNAAGFNNQTRGQDIQEGLLERQQPLQEYNAFRTGNAPTMPQFQGYSPQTIKAPDTYGAVKDTYAAQVGNANARQAGYQSLINLGASYFGG
jgi:hypothetical protein